MVEDFFNTHIFNVHDLYNEEQPKSHVHFSAKTLTYFADCAVVYSCYRFDSFWKPSIPWIQDLTNVLCENYCKNASAKNIYYGTSVRFFTNKT